MRSGPWTLLLGTFCARAAGPRTDRADERDAALADFRAALELARPQMRRRRGRSPFPRTRPLHNLEQLIYWSRSTNLRPARCCRSPPIERVAQRKLNQMLDSCRRRDPAIPWAPVGRLVAVATRAAR